MELLVEVEVEVDLLVKLEAVREWEPMELLVEVEVVLEWVEVEVEAVLE
jgi:hypothetical protein